MRGVCKLDSKKLIESVSHCSELSCIDSHLRFLWNFAVVLYGFTKTSIFERENFTSP